MLDTITREDERTRAEHAALMGWVYEVPEDERVSLLDAGPMPEPVEAHEVPDPDGYAPADPDGGGECSTCRGGGEVRHPMWGARNCPDPTITCPDCRGHGEP